MYTLVFQKNGESFIIKIEGKTIHYWDKKEGEIWGGPIRFLPKDPNNVKKIIMSRGRIPAYFLAVLNISQEEFDEFEKAVGEEELRELVLNDCKKNMCTLVKEMKS